MLAGEVDFNEPYESNLYGCPGSWYRTRFFASLEPYMRREDKNGGFSPNTLLDRTDDQLVHQAVAYFEGQRQRWHSWVESVQVRAAKMKAKHGRG